MDEDTQEECNGAAIDPVMQLASPARGLSFTTWSLVPGLGVYLGTLWTSGGNNVPGENDNRNIFLCFICCIAFELVRAATVGFIAAADNNEREELEGDGEDEEEPEQAARESTKESIREA